MFTTRQTRPGEVNSDVRARIDQTPRKEAFVSVTSDAAVYSTRTGQLKVEENEVCSINRVSAA